MVKVTPLRKHALMLAAVTIAGYASHAIITTVNEPSTQLDRKTDRGRAVGRVRTVSTTTPTVSTAPVPEPTEQNPVSPASAGAKLPISYDLSSVSGAKLYVSTNGSDSTGNGSASAPYKTVRKALGSVKTNPTTILVGGGTYSLKAEGDTYIQWSKSGYAVTIKAMPGQTPTFDGSKPAPTAATSVDGQGAGGANLKYVSYSTVAAGIGAGLRPANLPKATFSGTTPTGLAAKDGWKCVSGSSYTNPTGSRTSSNPSGCTSGAPHVISAYYPDQAWYDGKRLDQVLQKDKVTATSFYVERSSSTDGSAANTRLYVHSSLDLAKLRVSHNKHDIRITHPNTTLEGLRIIRNSPGPGTGNYSTLYLSKDADNTTLRNLEFVDNASIAVNMSGNQSNALSGVTVDRVTATNSGWQGAGAMYTDNLTIRNSLITRSNTDREYKFAPASGGIKLSRVYKTKILGSEFRDNYSSGVWFDQQNYDTDVVGNRFIGNASSAFFYEISHKLIFANNYVKATGADIGLRAAGSGDVKIVNNTFVGGGAGVAVYTDDRSKKYDSNGDGKPDRLCAENAYRYGGTFYAGCRGMSSDLNRLHPGSYGSSNHTPGMDWMPELTMLVNNIFTDQSTAGDHSNCTYDALSVCLTAYHDRDKIRVNPLEIIPSSAVINGNIYQVNDSSKKFFHLRLGSGQTCGISATTLSSLKSTLADTACYKKTVEANGKYSSSRQYADADGSPRSTLNHTEAAPVPNDARLNTYLPAGTRHYGMLR